MMWYHWVLFFTVSLFAKLGMAMLIIYWLLPRDGECNQCEGETLRLEKRGVGRVAGWAFLGRVERRWCPRCGWEGVARPRRVPVEPSRTTLLAAQVRARLPRR